LALIEKEQPRLSQGSFENAFRSQVNAAVMELIAESGLPLSFANQPALQRLIDVVKQAPASTRLPVPSQHHLRGKLLDSLYEQVQQEVKEVLDTQPTLTINMDGWTAPSGHPYVNIIATCPLGSFYIKTVDALGDDKDAKYYLGILDDIFAVYGRKIVAVITDSPSVNRKLWQLLEAKYPYVTGGGCMAHALNSYIKDCARIDAVAAVIAEAAEVVHFVLNHHFTLAALTEVSTKTLYCPAETRFGTNVMMISRLLDMRDALSHMLVRINQARWNDKLKKLQPAQRAIGATVRNHIKSDAFWSRLEEFNDLFFNTFAALRFTDTAAPIMGHVYLRLHSIYIAFDASIKARSPVGHPHHFKKEDVMQMKELFYKRWELCTNRLHYAAFMVS
jgi:hypothetical protein